MYYFQQQKRDNLVDLLIRYCFYLQSDWISTKTKEKERHWIKSYCIPRLRHQYDKIIGLKKNQIEDYLKEINNVEQQQQTIQDSQKNKFQINHVYYELNDVKIVAYQLELVTDSFRDLINKEIFQNKPISFDRIPVFNTIHNNNNNNNFNLNVNNNEQQPIMPKIDFTSLLNNTQSINQLSVPSNLQSTIPTIPFQSQIQDLPNIPLQDPNHINNNNNNQPNINLNNNDNNELPQHSVPMPNINHINNNNNNDNQPNINLNNDDNNQLPHQSPLPMPNLFNNNQPNINLNNNDNNQLPHQSPLPIPNLFNNNQLAHQSPLPIPNLYNNQFQNMSPLPLQNNNDVITIPPPPANLIANFSDPKELLAKKITVQRHDIDTEDEEFPEDPSLSSSSIAEYQVCFHIITNFVEFIR